MIQELILVESVTKRTHGTLPVWVKEQVVVEGLGLLYWIGVEIGEVCAVALTVPG